MTDYTLLRQFLITHNAPQSAFDALDRLKPSPIPEWQPVLTEAELHMLSELQRGLVA